MSVAQAELLIILDAALRKQAGVGIVWPSGISLICIITEYAAVCLTAWLIHVCIINAGMSRGKDKSLVNVKRNTGVGYEKTAQTDSHTNQILQLKTQCRLSDALVFKTTALFELTETMIVDPQQSKTATGPVKYADEMWDCYTLKDFQRKTRSTLFPLPTLFIHLICPLLSFSLSHTLSLLHYNISFLFLFIILLHLLSLFNLHSLGSEFHLYPY